jgi:transposase InsO family protein
MRGVAHDPVLRAKLMALHEQGRTLQELSQEYAIARPVLSRWWARYQESDLAGLQPLSRKPHQSPRQLSDAAEWRILRWRGRGWGAARIAHQLRLGQGTVQRVLERAGENRLPRPKRAPVQRYEKQRPGELLHLDIKFLPALRNARWDYEFAAIDDYSREAVVWITTEQTSLHATQFLEKVVLSLPYRIEAVMTDNGLAFSMKHAFHSERLTRFQQACRSLGIEHKLLRPYAPECNGKVERFFRTVDEECLNIQPLFTPKARARALDKFVWYYNHQRPHLSLSGKTPFQRRVEFFSVSGDQAEA